MENVNHPAHYNREGRKECIEEMLESFGVEYVRAFCICNVFKYCYRHSRKGGEEDLKKSGWYARKFIELGGDTAELAKITIY